MSRIPTTRSRSARNKPVVDDTPQQFASPSDPIESPEENFAIPVANKRSRSVLSKHVIDDTPHRNFPNPSSKTVEAPKVIPKRNIPTPSNKPVEAPKLVPKGNIPTPSSKPVEAPKIVPKGSIPTPSNKPVEAPKIVTKANIPPPSNKPVEAPKVVPKGNFTTPSNKPVEAPKVVPKGLSRLKILEAAAKAADRKVDVKSNGSGSQQSCQMPWVDKYHFTNTDELFVHKKKVEEVECWLQKALEHTEIKSNQFPVKKTSKVCVLSGPSGSGKTATIMTVAKQLNVGVKEWINPTSLTEFDATKVFVFGDEVTGRSQADLFASFLFRSCQYLTLPIKGRLVQPKWITIIEDFPNVFYRDTASFQNILRNLSSAASPVVFIVGDTSSDGNANKLFPKNIREDLGIPLITFNAVAPTFMVKYLTLLCGREAINVPKHTIEEIAAVSGGDIRSAINSLQFHHQKTVGVSAKQTFKKPFPVRQKKDTKKGESTKDQSLFLFHALGKVLYGKRNMKEVSKVEYELVERNSNERRLHPLENNPEDLCNMIEVSAETFIYFLQQNFIQFFTSLEDCAKASSYMADAEHILSNWAFDSSNNDKSMKVRERKEEVALSVATRGLMHSNSKHISSAWKPLRKPICNDLHTRIQKSVEECQSLCPARTEGLQMNFYTDYFPYFAKIKASSLPGDKKLALHNLAIGSGKKNNRIDDTDLGDIHNLEETKNEINWSCPTAEENDLPQECLEDESEFNIEEFDD